MKKILLTLLFGIFGFTTIYASFPVTENITTEVVTINESDPEPLTNGEKALWFCGGLLLSWIGVIIAIISQLSSKKKGQIKYALFGFGTLIMMYILLINMFFGGIDFGGININDYFL